MSHQTEMLGTKPAYISARTARIFIAVVCLAVWLALALLVTRGGFPTPHSDEFRFWRLYADAQEGILDFSALFKLHNGAHLYALLKLWFWAIVRWNLDWRISMHLQVFLIIAMVGMMLKYGMGKRPTRFSTFMALTAALSLSSARQWDNLYWAMQISAAAMLLASMLSFYHVERLHATQKTSHAALAIFFALIAMLSSGAGMVTLPITTAAIFFVIENRRLKIIALSATCATLAACAVLVFWHPEIRLFISKFGIGRMSGSGFLASAKKLVLYFPQFFSNAPHPFSLHGDDAASLCSGAAMLALSAYILLSSSHSGSRIFPRLLICFSLASCCAIAFVRINLSDPAASRYYPIAATMLAGNALAFRHPENPWHKTVAILLAAFTAASFIYNYGIQFKEAPQHKQQSRAEHLWVCSGNDKNRPNELAWIAQSPEDPAYSDLKTIRRVFCREKDMRQIQSQAASQGNNGEQR